MYLAESQAAFIKQGWQVGKVCHAYAPQQILLLQMRRGECAVFAVRQIDVFSDFLFRIVCDCLVPISLQAAARRLL